MSNAKKPSYPPVGGPYSRNGASRDHRGSKSRSSGHGQPNNTTVRNPRDPEIVPVLRPDVSAAVFEEWRSTFKQVLSKTYSRLVESLDSDEYITMPIPNPVTYRERRLQELIAQYRAERGLPDEPAIAATQAPTISQPALPNPRSSARQRASAEDASSSASSSTSSTANPSPDGGLSAEVIAELNEAAKQEYSEIVRTLRKMEQQMMNDRRGMQSTIWLRLSRESVERIKLHPLWTRIEGGTDPQALWKAIILTHTLYSGNDEIFDYTQALSVWTAMRQSESQGLPQFKVAFDMALEDLRARARPETVPNGQEIAMRFITSLDPTRFADLQVTYRNKVKPYPDNMVDAYRAAAEWVVVPRYGLRPSRAATGQQTAFTICAAANAFVSQAQKGQPQGKGRKADPTRPPETPKNTNTRYGEKALKQRSPSGNGHYKTPTSLEKRDGRCMACGEPGHYIKNCPVFRDFTARRQQQQEGTDTALAAVAPEGDAVADELYSRYMRKFGATALTTVHAVFPTEVRVSDTIMAADCLTPTEVLLDNQATKGIFGNSDLLSDITKVNSYTTFSGVGGSLKTNLVGTFGPLGVKVHYSPNFGYNVLSFSDVEDKHEIVYSPRRSFKVSCHNGKTYEFLRRVSGLWSCNFAGDADTVAISAHKNGTDPPPSETVAIQTVQENESMFSRREIKAAKAARELSKRLGYPSSQDLQSMLRRGVINNSPVTAQDVQRAERLYGPEVASLKGKTKAVKPTVIKPIPLPKYVVTELTMLCDLMYIEGDPYLVSVTKPLGLLMVSDLMGSRSKEHIRDSLDHQLREYLAREFIITVIWTDREGAIIALRNDLMEVGIRVEPVTASRHVPGIEVRIRIIKERCRAILNSLPFLLPRSLLKYLVMYVTSRINLIPSEAVRTDHVSPREAFLGRRVDFNIDCRIAFGECVQIRTDTKPSNTMAPRTEMAIAMGPKESAIGSVLFWVWRSKKIIERDSWTAVIPMSEGIIEAINAQAYTEGRLVGKMPKFRVGNHEVVDIPTQTTRDNQDLSRQPLERRIQAAPAVDVDSIADVIPRRQDTRSLEPKPADEKANMDMHFDEESERLNQETEPSYEEGSLENHQDTLPPAANQESSAASPPSLEYLSPLERAALESTNKVTQPVLHMSVNKSIETWGDHAIKAISAEIQQMVEMEVFHGVHKSSLSEQEKRGIILCHMFLKEKKGADGKFQKIKARLVAGGDRQDRSVYESISSPTASLTAVLIIAAIAARTKRITKSTDVTGAYLNARMGSVKVYMKIAGKLAMLLVQVAPQFGEFLAEDGSIIVKLDKAMYGCIESARLWYSLLTDTLVHEYGMTANPYESCVLNKITESGHQLTVVIYVDDLLITCASGTEVDAIIGFLRAKFNTITVHDGQNISYLGMSLDFSADGKVKITMPGYVNDVLNELGVQGTAVTPATTDLFDVSSEEVEKGEVRVLSSKEAKTFHTTVAKLLYLAKRARPDILCAITFLASRVQQPTAKDEAKLLRVLKYLNGTRDLGICLEQDHPFPVAYCDAAYGVHHDGKSHSGLYISLGSGPIYVGSSKQKIVVKSSTEAELVALSDALGQIVWTREFIRAQEGIDQDDPFPPAVVMEDNTSTITLLKSGKLYTQRTKHISIRYFVMKDRMQQGEIFMRHIGTEDMIADIFTKPLQGATFARLRSILLNHS